MKVLGRWDCLCGGQNQSAFKRPGYFQNTVVKQTCEACKSELNIIFERAPGMRANELPYRIRVVDGTKELANAIRKQHGKTNDRDRSSTGNSTGNLPVERDSESPTAGPKVDVESHLAHQPSCEVPIP